MNTIEALEYLRNNPKSAVSKREENRKIVMTIDQELLEWNDLKYVEFTLVHDFGATQEIDFSGWLTLDDEWVVSKEVRYYVKIKVPEHLNELMGDKTYLNLSKYKYRYTLDTNAQCDSFQTKFTRDEIEEFGIEHPEVRREDLEFIEVVE